jgi:multiple antibiotic resistance protein
MSFLSSIFPLAVKFFLIANPIGNSPAIIALVKNFEFKRQKQIIFREVMIALFIALFFQYFGEFFLGMLNIQDFALTFCGGILLFLVALQMIFAEPHNENSTEVKTEPFIVPIATPILSGPGLMAIIMLNSRLESNNLKITSAILLCWLGIYLVLWLAPYLQKILGQRGLVALEQLMGMILSFMAMGMIVKGMTLFLKTFN